ncbi:CapA family protein [Clostridium tagluense]|uniref:CapA family protein n=1 Tax=Clostridium tagluense TaxID=360422 RepID=UPI001CF2A65F|nr:CapA family protein [Clostridium tagluense]MCB2313914.1 CapA family protein [Clostridium tagluense]MCB2318717.1 CapA family protein [Clostridium tagluense]MCB2323486.1 CapA family protein [Clostridium tagluense]MCB2328475.1 CapA family protein [Clostridium tagluense]MCB2333328.1 CapA family protein [Clostridium tagluense]
MKKSRKRKLNKKKAIRNISLLLFVSVILTTVVVKTISFSLKKFNAIYATSNEEKKKPSDKDTSNNETAKANTVEKNTEVLLSAVGDCTIGTDSKFDYATSLPAMVTNFNKDFSYYFKNVHSIFSRDDVTIANLETTFTDSNDKEEKQYNFKATSDFAKSLTLGSIEGVNLSNNHIYDYKEKGFQDTKLALEKEKVNFFGEKSKWITKIKGKTFGFLGYRGWSTDQSFLDKLKEDILELKKTNSVIVINFHWGNEKEYYPIDAQKKLARFAIDNGADIILGHHPHVIQGIEQYKNRIIAYSLGNFCFGGNANPSDKRTFIFQSNLKFTSNNLTAIGVRVIPCSISSVDYKNDYCPTPLSGDAKLNLLSNLNKLSPNSGFKISDEFSYINVNNNN